MVDVSQTAGCNQAMTGITSGLLRIQRAVLRAIGREPTNNVTGAEPQVGHARRKSGLSESASTAPLKLSHEPRRYKRAHLLTGGEGVQLEIASAGCDFLGRSFPVVDLSHAGVAIERAGLLDSELPDASKLESLTLRCGVLPIFLVQASLVRASDRVLAFEFVNVPTEGRLTIDRFLDPKMIGLNMRPVDRSFFSPGETFSLWFCGPRDTNFFLWMSDGHLDRAIIQLGEEQFTLAPVAGRGNGIRFVRQNQPNSRVTGNETDLRDSVVFVLDVALQVRNGGEAIAGLVRLLTEAADTLQPGT